jgi:PTS system nitrogen regulatory IIA component
MTPDPFLPIPSLSLLIGENRILCGLKARDREGVLREISEFLESRDADLAGAGLFESLMQREKLGSTALGEGFALPHCKIPDLSEPRVGVAVSSAGAAFESLDGKPTKFFFVVLGAAENPGRNLQVLASIAQLIRTTPRLGQALLRARTPRDVLEIITPGGEGRP